jgi:hypothetical protein
VMDVGHPAVQLRWENIQDPSISWALQSWRFERVEIWWFWAPGSLDNLPVQSSSKKQCNQDKDAYSSDQNNCFVPWCSPEFRSGLEGNNNGKNGSFGHQGNLPNSSQMGCKYPYSTSLPSKSRNLNNNRTVRFDTLHSF